MEVWLESLSLHLSVNIPLPADLLFDIQHYRGTSPSSSGSTTPEGITSGHRSPALEPIKEGKLAATGHRTNNSVNDVKKTVSSENLKPIIKVSSADNIVKSNEIQLKPIIKISGNEILSRSSENCYIKLNHSYEEEFSTKSCENVMYDVKDTDISAEAVILHPTYENLGFLLNDRNFSQEKEICDKKLQNSTKLGKQINMPMVCGKVGEYRDATDGAITENNLRKNSHSTNKFRRMPKNFTRNCLDAEKFDFSEPTHKTSETHQENSNFIICDNIKQLGKRNTLEISKSGKNSEGKFLNLSLKALKNSSDPSKVTQKFIGCIPKSDINQEPLTCTKQKFNSRTDEGKHKKNVNFGIKRNMKPSPNRQLLEPIFQNTHSPPKVRNYENLNDLHSNQLTSNLNVRTEDDLDQTRNSRSKSNIPDVVSSTLKDVPPRTLQESSIKDNTMSKIVEKTDERALNPFSINKSIFKGVNSCENVDKNHQIFPVKASNKNKSTLEGSNVFQSSVHTTRGTPVLRKRFESDNVKESCPTILKQEPLAKDEFSYARPSTSGLVRNIIDSLNRRDHPKVEFRKKTSFERSSLKVTGSPKVKVTGIRSSSPEEFTEL